MVRLEDPLNQAEEGGDSPVEVGGVDVEDVVVCHLVGLVIPTPIICRLRVVITVGWGKNIFGRNMKGGRSVHLYLYNTDSQKQIV